MKLIFTIQTILITFFFSLMLHGMEQNENVNALLLDRIELLPNDDTKLCPYEVSPTDANTSVISYDDSNRGVVKLAHHTGHIPSAADPQVLALIYSRCLTSEQKLLSSDIEILGVYEVAAMPRQSPTRIGNTGQLVNQMNIETHFEFENLTQQIEEGNSSFYLQLGLLDKRDYITQNFSKVKLSNIHRLIFAAGECPSSEQIKEMLSAPNHVCKTEKPTE